MHHSESGGGGNTTEFDCHLHVEELEGIGVDLTGILGGRMAGLPIKVLL